MSRKLKKFILTSTISSSLLLAPLSISASNKRLDGDQNNPHTDKKEKQISELFNSFKTRADAAYENSIKTILDKLININTKRITELKEAEVNGDNLAELFYRQQLLNFLTKNKDNIIKNPLKYNFVLMTPFTLSRNKELEEGEVKYGDKLYSNVKFGTPNGENHAEYDAKLKEYKKLLNVDKLENSKKLKNVITNDEFTKFLEGYYARLDEKILSIINPKEDIFKFKEDIELVYTDDSTIKTQFTQKWIEKNKDFDSYFLNKIKPRFIEFDLEENNNVKIEEIEKQPENEEQEPNLDEIAPPPLTPPGDSNEVDTEPIDINTVVESLPPLSPFVKPEFVNYSHEEIKLLFDNEINDSKEADVLKKASEKFFFFNNPINTRIKYFVRKLEVDKDKNGEELLKAYVEINDRVPSRSGKISKRTYLIAVNNKFFSNDKNKAAQSLIYYNQIQEIKATFNKFYDALLLDDKINYNQLNNRALAISLSSMVDLAIKITEGTEIKFPSGVNNEVAKHNFNKNEFKNIQRELIKKFSSEINTSNIDSEANKRIINESNDQIRYEFLYALTFSKINNFSYFNYMVNAHTDSARGIVNRLAKASKANRKDFIQPNFNLNKLDIDVLERLVRYTNRSTQNLQGVSISPAVDLNRWYEKYLSYLKHVRKSTVILSVLVGGHITTTNKEEDSYDKQLKEKKNNPNPGAGSNQASLTVSNLNSSENLNNQNKSGENKPATDEKDKSTKKIYINKYLDAYNEANKIIKVAQKEELKSISKFMYPIIAVATFLLILTIVLGGIYLSKHKNKKLIVTFSTAIPLTLLILSVGVVVVLLATI
ncbi:MSC_0620 family F1-like ATPase-associated subunit [Mycoplasmopsis opalescens]|uniref:MSC_0620 family F1-like ATPase-associated subunit n=1 Tax=Mycoplasmopsis opalescens TaxID=114886 RepID=UPI0004A6F1EE|nr:hypothetical protein [Mycoplasmopsis opalescens]